MTGGGVVMPRLESELLHSVWIGPGTASGATETWMLETVIWPSAGPNDCWFTVNVKTQTFRSGSAVGQRTVTGLTSRPELVLVVMIGRSFVAVALMRTSFRS